MLFLNIDPKNYNVSSEKLHDKSPIEVLNDSIKNGKHVFILIFMVGCGPCEATIPEWKKIQNVLENQKSKKHNLSNVVIVDMDKDVFEKLKNNDKEQRLFKSVYVLNSSISGFPTIKYITKNGKITDDYEEAHIKLKDRTIDSFIEWINTTMNSSSKSKALTYKQRGGFIYSKNKKNNLTTRSKSSKSLTGGKWSRKYKKSINCRKPKGFSQKQYCKYSRK
jgi:thiol-disulfide isomerase/thioredoxin